MARSPLHDDHHTFAIRRWLHARRLAVNQPVVAKGVAGLKIIGFLKGKMYKDREGAENPATAKVLPHTPPRRPRRPGPTYGAVRLLVPLDQETGAVPDDHPLQVGRHGESSSRSSSQRCKETHSIS